MTETSSPSLTAFQAWVLAARPKTLPAAAAPVIVGSAAAFSQGRFHFLPGLAALLAALLLQVGANLANDVFDFYRGADRGERLGPTRVTQSGILAPQQVLKGTWVVFGLAVLLGVYLVWVAGLPILFIGLASVLAALAYTGGPLPYGYYGLGDLFVFLFFGLAAVCGTYYIHAGEIDLLALIASIPMGLLITAILVVNNLRDLENDRRSGKRTLAVFLGERGTVSEYIFCVVIAYLVPVGMFALSLSSPWILLTLLSLPLAIQLIRQISKVRGRALNHTLAATGRLTLLYGVLMAIGFLI